MTGLLMRTASVAIAILVAFALPVGGVRTQLVDIQCCCPSPERCKCPDHEEPPIGPTMQTCHKTLETFSTPPIPPFVSPVQHVVAIAEIAAPVEHAPLPVPHAPPLPRRPAAPS